MTAPDDAAARQSKWCRVVRSRRASPAGETPDATRQKSHHDKRGGGHIVHRIAWSEMAELPSDSLPVLSAAGGLLARRLALPVSGDTLLRLVRRGASAQPLSAPTVIGIGDFAWKHGQRR